MFAKYQPKEYNFSWQLWTRKKTSGLISVPCHALKIYRYWICNFSLDGDQCLASRSEWGAPSVHCVGARRETHWTSLNEYCGEDTSLLWLSWMDRRCVRCPTRRLVTHRLSCSASLRSVLALFKVESKMSGGLKKNFLYKSSRTSN
jgi:hypothetical protein